MIFRPAFLIPCYNHGRTLPALIAELQARQLPVLIVDDGSDPATKEWISQVQQQFDLQVLTLAQNSGKGGAVSRGFRYLAEQGFSHAIQVDADGQHDLDALPALLAAAEREQSAVVSGFPRYDDSIPKGRLYGRYLTHVWVWLETLSLDIKDSMCGFRIYPLTECIRLLNRRKLGQRMDFDIEVLVRLYWQGVPVRFVPTQVRYPSDGLSHFDILHDNLRISWMHTRLMLEFPWQALRLLSRRMVRRVHWSRQRERGHLLGMRLLLATYLLLGRGIFSLLLLPVMGYFYWFSKGARQASLVYLKQLRATARVRQVSLPRISGFRHFLQFGHSLLDKLAAWLDKIPADAVHFHGEAAYREALASGRGIMLLGSHLGNLELCRALSRHYCSVPINALVYTQHAEQFNRLMTELNPKAQMNLIQVTDIGADTAILLKQKLEKGEWVVMVGDRTSTRYEDRVVWQTFLGRKAPFPQGPFVLASVLRVPVYLMFGFRNGKGFDIYFEPFRQRLELPRQQRQQALAEVVADYARRLEDFALRYPLQWFNFYDFWKLSNESRR